MRITRGQLGRIIREEATRLREAGARGTRKEAEKAGWGPRSPGPRRPKSAAVAAQRASLSPEDQAIIQHLGDAMDSLKLALEPLESSNINQALAEYINAAVLAVAKARMVLRGQKF